MLKYTTSFGVRETRCARYVLSRSIEEKQTSLGPIRMKHGEGYGIAKSKPEYEDVAAAAEKNGLSFTDIVEGLLK
jgi:uncharacterized protein (DUF111 family)